jgi:hypothetical protein
MLCGSPPFYSENLEKMYELIKTSDIKWNKRINISEEAKDIIQKVYFILIILLSLVFKQKP